MLVRFTDGSIEHYSRTPIGSGAEGEVFPSQDGRHLVKIYMDQRRTADLTHRIDDLITRYNPTKGDPYWEEYFAWPDKRVVSVDGAPKIGFRMHWAKDVRALGHYIFGKAFKLLRPEQRGWFIGRVATAIKLVTAANRLSSLGLCYPDFSDNNVLVEPFEGLMTLIDCDSLTVPGAMEAKVAGTTWYLAPELVTGAIRSPSILTDRHNLAVLLYLWLLTWHPLIGDRVYDPRDPDNDDRLRYGARATYIEHATDTSNRAKGQVVKASVLGPEMQALFRTAFEEGLHHPKARPQPAQWLEALNRLYDRLVPCESPRCDWHWFPATPVRGLQCPKCGYAFQNPSVLPFVTLLPHQGTRDPDDFVSVPNGQHQIAGPQGKHSYLHYIVGWPERAIHSWHINASMTPNYRGPTQPVDRAPYARFEFDAAHQQWCLLNLRTPNMRCRFASDAPNAWRPWPVNVAHALEQDMVIQFGDAPDHFRAQVNLVQVR